MTSSHPSERMAAAVRAAAVRPAPGGRRISDRYFVRLLGLVRKRLFSRIRDEKDVLVVDSVLSSFFAHHAPEELDLDDPEGLWDILARIGLRHCNKHNKRMQRDAAGPVTLSGASADDSSEVAFDPAGDDPPPEAEVEFLDFLARFQEKLTPRERKVLEFALDQEAQGDMAGRLEVSQTTICNDLKRIRAALEGELAGLT